jgi:uncharacterized Zn-binding protein involved in type VI secretion
MGEPVARVGDSIGHGTVLAGVFTGTITGTITGPGNSTVLPGGLPVAKQLDAVVCSDHPSTDPNVILIGSPTVRTLLGVAGIARMGDATTCGAVVASGLPSVLVGP